MCLKGLRSSTQTRTSEWAMQEAERGRPYSTPSSPKPEPGPMIRFCFSPISTCTLPSMTT